MRYAIIIPDGAADRPARELGGRTPLAAAAIPGMDRLARAGRLGRTRTVPPGMAPGSDVANLALLGYDPASCYTGRAPLEAAAMGLRLAAGEAVFRANTVCIQQGRMRDYAAGHIPSSVSRPLVEWLDANLDMDGVRLHPGKSYRHLCCLRRMAESVPERAPPHDITGQAVDAHAPRGDGAARLLAVEERCRRLLAKHPVNLDRVATGKLPVTQLWLWGGGTMPELRTLRERSGIRGGVISAVDLLQGIGRLAGMDVIKVPGATGYYDTDYAGKGRAALDYLGGGRGELVVVHVEAPDEAGHNGHAREKVRALENIDRHIIVPLLEAADRDGDLRILCVPDHPTPLCLRTHTADPVPFTLWGPGLRAQGAEGFTEDAAADRQVVPAHALIGMLTRDAG